MLKANPIDLLYIKSTKRDIVTPGQYPSKQL